MAISKIGGFVFMTDFIKEIKLSHNAYYCWQEIKEEIEFKMTSGNDKAILYDFDSSDLMQEVTIFLIECGFEVYTGESAWQNFPEGYDIEGFRNYCNYQFRMIDDDFVKINVHKIPCVIKW